MAQTSHATLSSARRFISLGVADITPREIELVTDCLRSGKISPGEKTQQFEERVAVFHQMRFGTFCNSGQSALHLSLEALKLRHPKVRLVLAPAITYISTLHAIWNAGLEVVLCDVDPKTYNINLGLLEPSARYDVAIPVHMFGKSVQIPPQSVPVVEDACESLGAPGIGYGDLVCLSFYVAHTITTAVGGMVLTNRPELNEDVKRLCNHGRACGSDLYAGLRVDALDDSIRFTFNDVGFSFKLGDLNAALGLGQMERIEQILQCRVANARVLIEGLRDLPALQLPDPANNTFMMFPIVCATPELKIRLVRHLNDWGVETRDMMPLTNQPIVRRILGDVEDRFPNARRINACGFYIGCHQRLTPDDVAYLVDVFHRVTY
ncbi:MAG: DegT/DnrJ/EryC1/StrS family aminotransferase [Candidatus Omnitrophica bacterium]|nr:DegT/DnrJ/EryC1/StrS family aminotransferase [Candidatus Omnitrophota bacterium]